MMPGISVIAGHVLIPLAFGLVPALLPSRMAVQQRWGIWLLLAIAGSAYAYWLQSAADPFPWLVIASFSLSSLLSLFVLVVATMRRRRGKART